MGGLVGVDHIQFRGDFPFDEPLYSPGYYNPFKMEPCPNCSSIHQTTFKSFYANSNKNPYISGDLGMKTMVIGRCLGCGLERPLQFIYVREA